MRYLAALLLGFSVLGLLQACKKDNDVDPGFGPNGEPRILAIHIPYVPDQNIQVDQNLKQIVVTLPTSFSANEIQPVYTLTPSSKVTDTNEIYLLPASGFTGGTVSIVTDANVKNSYQYIFKPTGDLYFAKATAPISYTVTKDDGNNGGFNPVCFFVYNYVDSVGASTLILTNKQTGKQLTFSQAGERSCNGYKQVDGAVAVQAIIDRRTYYQPGEYRVELVKASGRRATSDQSFQLQRGVPTLYLGENFNRPFLLGVPSYNLPGANILQSDKLTLRLRSRNQNPITVQPLGLLADQPGIQLPSLAGINPGYYYAQLVLNGVDVASYIRLMLVSNANDLAITYVRSVDETGQYSLLDPAVSLDVPLSLSYGHLYNVLTNKNLSDVLSEHKIPRIRLTLVSDPSKTYYLPLNTDSALISSLKYGTFAIPATLPAGRYQLTYQLVLPDQSIISTLPLERDVLIQ